MSDEVEAWIESLNKKVEEKQMHQGAKGSHPDSTCANVTHSSAGPPLRLLLSGFAGPDDVRSEVPQQHDRKVLSFRAEASHYDNGLTRPTEQSWKGFKTAAEARQAITNLITWPPYSFRRVVLQDLSNPEDPRYSVLRDGFVKGGRKDAVFTLEKVVAKEPVV